MVDGGGVKWHRCSLLEVAMGGLRGVGCASCRAEVSEKFRVVVADPRRPSLHKTRYVEIIGREPRQQRVRAASAARPGNTKLVTPHARRSDAATLRCAS